MAYVIAEPCVGVVDTACVDVCPTDAIHGPVEAEEIRATRDQGGQEAVLQKYGADIQLYIDPEECIDCGACATECPAEAIFDQDELPEKWASYIDKAVQFYQDR
ncbi:MAG: 4Fe-4S binding protein [Bradymonadales bacterium]|nr:4Fe-4S binding protein [Bradymonadales bacterium]